MFGSCSEPPNHVMTNSGSQDTDIAALFRQYGKGCARISRDKADVAARLCEIHKASLQAKPKTWAASANGQPILVHFSNNETPISTKRQVKGTSSNHSATRLRRDTKEYQVQHVVDRSIVSSGRPLNVAVFRNLNF